MPVRPKQFLNERTTIKNTTMQSAITQAGAGAGPQAQDLTDISKETSLQVSYFEEGTGFIYLTEVGSGLYGTVSLVQSTNGKLYARKEDRIPQPTDHFDIDPSQEIQIANKLKHIQGIAQIKGWTKYEMGESHQVNRAFYVSYWDYYNMGTLWDLRTMEQYPNSMYIPDCWLFSWAAAMLRTILDIHRNGVVHNDAHARNWFLDWDSKTDMPTVYLGDFDQARLAPQMDLYSTSGEHDLRPEVDFYKVGMILEQISKSPRAAVEQSAARQNLSEWAKDIQFYAEGKRGSALEEVMEEIADTIEADSKDVAVHTSEETDAFRPLASTKIPALGHLKPSFSRTWKTISLQDGRIIPESTQTPNTMYSSVRLSGIGEWDSELDPRPKIESLAFI